LAGRTGQRVLDNLATAMKCRDLARMSTDVPVPTAPTCRPSPAPADVVTMLDLWAELTVTPPGKTPPPREFRVPNLQNS
jgi:hypothetical protein